MPQLDPAAIERLVVLGGPELVQEVAALFREHGRLRVEQIQAAWEGSDLAAVAAAAHSLRSSSAQLGLRGCARLARQLEERGRAGDVAGVGLGMVSLEDEFRRAVEALRTLSPDS